MSVCLPLRSLTVLAGAHNCGRWRCRQRPERKGSGSPPGHERVHGAQSVARPEAIDSPPAAGFGKQPVGWTRRTWSQPDAGPGTGRAGKQVPSSGSNQPKKSVWDPLPAQSSVSATHPNRENPMKAQGCRRWGVRQAFQKTKPAANATPSSSELSWQRGSQTTIS